MSFLGLEGLHVFVTGAAGGIGSAMVEEFLGTSLATSVLYDKSLFVMSYSINVHAQYIQLVRKVGLQCLNHFPHGIIEHNESPIPRPVFKYKVLY